MQLPIFIATKHDDVPAACTRYISVDGSVPGAAITWDHHVSGEAINLDALPQHIDLTVYDGLGTTLADTDAVCSMVAVLLGGPAHVPGPTIEVLRSASHWCDHLQPHPHVEADANQCGEGLHHWVVSSLHNVPADQRSATCARLVRDITHRVRSNSDLPSEPAPGAPAGLEARRQEAGPVALFDVREDFLVTPEAAYRTIPLNWAA